MRQSLYFGLRSAARIRRIRTWESLGAVGIPPTPDQLNVSLFRSTPVLVGIKSHSTITDNMQSQKKEGSTRRRRLREIRRGRRVKKSLMVVRDLPERSPEDFANFFDAIMPPFTLAQIEEVMGRISSKTKMVQPNMPLPTVLQNVLESTNPTDELQIHVLRFLIFDDSKTATSRSTVSVDQGYVDTLLLAREKAIRHPLFWNEEDLQLNSGDATRLLEPLQNHQSKSANQVQIEARRIAEFLRRELPSKFFKALMSALDDYVGNQNVDSTVQTLETVYEPERLDRPPMRLLSPVLFETTNSHFNLVGRELADFLYVNALENDANLSESAKQWKTSRDKFVQLLTELQDEILEAVKSDGEALSTENVTGNDAVDMAENNHGGLDAESQTNNTEDTAENNQIGLDSESQTGKSAKTVENKQEGTDAKSQTAKRNRIVHITFQARVEDAEEGATSTGKHGNIVFLDNLPIDITETELLELYSRCGKVDSVQIFNQRPDLDPGPLTAAQLMERKKKQLKSVATIGKTVTKWVRPRSPVYAIVNFCDEKGYERAVDDNLRIFGMLIRRHPVRSTPCSRLKSFFLEKIEGGKPCRELEYELEKALGLEIFLQPGQKSGVHVGSCEIVFPSFDVAWKAWGKINKLKIIKKKLAQAQWFRTLKDAEKWWLRERGFDF